PSCAPRDLHSFPTRRSSDLGQLAVLQANHRSAAIRNAHSIVTASPPAFLPVPKNTDSDSQQAGQLAKGYVEYEMDEEGGYEAARSEEHTSELQSRENLVCRL